MLRNKSKFRLFKEYCNKTENKKYTAACTLHTDKLNE